MAGAAAAAPALTGRLRPLTATRNKEYAHGQLKTAETQHPVHRWVQVPIQMLVNQWLESFEHFPPRAKAASFTVSDVMDKIMTASPNQN